MSIPDFIESLQKDKRFKQQIAALKHIPPMRPRYSKISLSERLRDILKRRGIELFYSHQVEAINLIREGENVVVMTPTASGKSLIYNIPVIESIIENPEHKALYIFPLKGLEQDQVRNLNELFYSVMTPSPAPPLLGKSPPHSGGFAEEDEATIKGGENRRDSANIYKPSPLVSMARRGEGKGEGDKRINNVDY